MAVTVTQLDFTDLDGWAADDHAAALAVFCNTCGDLTDPVWANVSQSAACATDARAFFEVHFRPVLIADGQPALFTGYFEPELRGTLIPDDVFRHPVYGLPPGLPKGQPWLTRQQIVETGALAGQGLEIAYVNDPVDLFFLQVQGSGRICLPDGQVIRVGYAGTNGQPYSSIGKELVGRDIFAADQISAQAIKDWIVANPEQGPSLLCVNQSFVFFRELTDVPANLGPLGAMNRSVTPMRTIAVDPTFTPLGAPVWIEKDGHNPMRRLMVAQDTGSAIRGAQRADIFFGTGDAAGAVAGRVKDSGRMIVLLPVQHPMMTKAI